MPRSRSPWLHAGALLGLMLAISIALATYSSYRRPLAEPGTAPPPMLPAEMVRTWKAAALRVEELRGQPVGRGASVTVPAELRHYAERRRFLAVQVAETEEHDIPLPHDEAELIEMIARDELVEMKSLGDDYILYGVGANATGEPFTHYDDRRNARIPLYDGWGDFKDADDALVARIEALKADIDARRGELRRTRVRARTRRKQLKAQIQTAEKELAALRSRRQTIAAYYEDWDRRRLVVSEYRLIRDFAARFGGRAYDLDNPTQRRLMRARLLSFVRLPARDLILELAREYQQRFQRPLPVTSLVRTEDYQRQLGRVNPNATNIDSPPHATGYAFDMHYGHMAADEQDYLMGLLAGMESEGRVEALRENRNHFHVFVFPDGRPPSETLIAEALSDIGTGVVQASRGTGGSRARLSARTRKAAAARKAPSKRRPASARRAPSSSKPSPARRSPAKKSTTRRRPPPR